MQEKTITVMCVITIIDYLINCWFVSGTHGGSRAQVACPLCNKTFARRGNLKVHMNIHTGERPFQCNICFKRFFTKSNLKSHLVYNHKDRLEVTTPNRKDNSARQSENLSPLTVE